MICRSCECSDTEPCVSEQGETCSWVPSERDLCSFCHELRCALLGIDPQPSNNIVVVSEGEAQRYIDELREVGVL